MSQESSTGFMESFQGKLDEIQKIIDEDKYRKRVLLLCQQEEPRSFDDYSSSGSFRKLERFESSTYSEVLKAVDLADNNKPVVMKIMRALSKGVIRKMPSVATKGCQSYNDILNELVITQALSQLHDGVLLNSQAGAMFRTTSFCLIHEIKVVSGSLDRTLSRSKATTATDSESETDTSEAPQKESNSGNREQAQKSLETIANNENNDITDNQSQKNANEAKDGKGSHESMPDSRKLEIQDDEMRHLSEEDKMLMAALPHEYVVSVMRHDGQPLWYMMTHKKLSSQQLTSVLVQVIVGLAIAEKVYLYEHRDLHVSNILVKKTQQSAIPFVLDGHHFNIVSHNIKATIIDATFSRLTYGTKVYYRDLTSTLRDYGANKTPKQMSLQNRSYRQMVRVTKNDWQEFKPKTNLIWLTYLCETLMKYEIMRKDTKMCAEIRKIRDYTLKVNTTLELLNCFPVDT